MMEVQRAEAADLTDWLMLRTALWPAAAVESPDEIRAILDNPHQVAFLARDPEGRPLGFAEAAIRHDYVNGCETSPAGFLEGIYVVPEAWRRGIAGALVEAVAEWARSQGCQELASDAAVDNEPSHKMHEALGFSETQRVVYFRRVL